MSILLSTVFLIGLFVGSFLNVIIDRLPKKETIVKGRSHCEFCHHVLAWYDLIPLLSYLYVSGRCRYCKKFIGYRYPLIELTTGVVFTLASIVTTGIPFLTLILGIVSCLVVIFYTDMLYGIIPDSVLLVLLLLAIVQKFFLFANWITLISTSLIIGLGFFFLFLLTKKKGIGLGDVKYAFVMGILLGFPYSIPALYIAFLTGATVALILVIRGKKRMKSSIPFGPFLVLGTFINLLWGQQLWGMFQKIVGL